MTSKLYSTLALGPHTLATRVCLAPMTRSRADPETCVPTDEMGKYYAERAGAGIIITEGIFTSEQANGWYGAPGLFNDAQTEGWTKALETVKSKRKDAVVFAQAWHCGRASHSAIRPNAEDGRGICPSPIKMEGDHKVSHTPKGPQSAETPREMTLDEIKALPQEYINFAQRAKKAGFEGVEIHAANGYLLNTFLDPKTNQRTDDYGGSQENRFRIVKEVIEAVLTVLPAHAVAIRLSPNGVFNDMGSPSFREDYLQYIKWLVPYELGYLHVMNGLGFGFHKQGEPVLLSEIRAVYPRTLMGNCGFSKEEAEKFVDDGEADLMSFGRPYISNPDLAERFKAGVELNPLSDHSTWYPHPDADNKTEGYLGFPTMNN